MNARPPFPRGLVLASTSPRRQHLLPWLGLPVHVHPVEVDETPQLGETPAAYVQRLARAKALRVSLEAIPSGWWVLAADTAVVLKGRILGKPSSPAHAEAMLRALQGRRHQVLTGFTLWEPHTNSIHTQVVATQVHMRPLQEGEIRTYVASGRAMDKAGGYGIQDREFQPVTRLGPVACFANVVGLPLCHIWRALILRSAPPHVSAPSIKGRCAQTWGYACPEPVAVDGR